ncbi:uncharacterized protein GGS22DRAFT_165772 [Annulohypoxylon maeteangense]|uniref:uncharacterized protein n=1 Tax=Annulohypoxylon maeteangense TaxID=1927788 RepID=UPI00200803D3|nr:uncharacterized protein GGS22DRAFT_165772 [Annulohypoxylon maeteangense]KAI0883676.1 hypothetical protein GGS22DRAFT_165772 [Annulohypoxylon maeteangense]
MEPSNNAQARAPPKPSKMNYACEACRISKVKCQSSPQPGICKRCSEFKRECVFRTGPRTRRPKFSTRPDAEALPPPPGPSKTFSIDFTMPADDDLRDNFDDLREKHERFIDDLVPSSDDDELEDDSTAMSPSAGQTFSFNDMSMRTPSLTTGSTASTNSRPVTSLAMKPQFNLDSAAKLLESFRFMLPHCPCIVLPQDADVRSMARDMPFVLLAILAVTSCSTSLQGHSLYDDEFRKILALKFVAGGERSVELLQGLIIYCSWYPFHLRPKNRQAVQYLRMAVDIVHDMELDEEKDINLAVQSPERREMTLQSIRIYLSCFYHASLASWTWSKPYSLKYTPWMAKCCELLEQHSGLQQDHVLIWIVRLQHILIEFEELNRSYKKPSISEENENQRTFIRIGLETQLRDFQSRIPGHISTIPSILMSSLTTDTYILAAPLMQTFHPRPNDPKTPLIDAPRLQASTYTTRAFLEYIMSLSAEQMRYFCTVDIGRLILTIILAYRLSFPVPSCPDYDYIQGRKVLDFGAVLANLSITDNDSENDTPDSKSKKVDVVTAFKVVLGSLKAKFERKSANLEAAEESRRARQCPMFDGSLDQYIPLWEGHQGNMDFAASSYTASSLDGGSAAAANLAAGVGPVEGLGKSTVFHDLWATMTMGWATDEAGVGLEQGVDLTGLGDTGEYVDIMGVGDMQG